MSASECKCLNPEQGGTKCPVQHVALCIRGKDRECYGECIPIPSSYRSISNEFKLWIQSVVNEKVNEHISEKPHLYRRAPNFREMHDTLRTEELADFSPKHFIYRNEIGEVIRAYFVFTFDDTIEPLGQRVIVPIQ